VQETQRDLGLVRAVGPWALAAGIFGMIVGAGIFAVPGRLAASVGSYAPLIFLGCGFAVGSVAICFAEGGSRLPTSGGVYGLIDAAFGHMASFVVGTLLWVSCALASGGVAAALADMIAALFPPAIAMAVRGAVIIVVIAAVAIVNMGGVARGARFVNVTTVIKFAPLALFIVAGAGAVHGSNFSQTIHPDTQSLGRAIILAVFAFVGMETPLCVSGEVREPNRTIPRALLLALAAITILYALIQVIAQGVLGPALASSNAPLADAMAQVHPLLRALMLAGTALSMFGYLAADVLGSPRQLFALARDGLMPSVLGRLHAGSSSPRIAILCYASLAAFLGLTGTFAELAVLATLAIAPLYIAGCAASWVLARRGLALAGPPLNFRFLGAAAAIGIGSMIVLIALGSRLEIIGLALLIGLSMAAYGIQAGGARLRVVIQRLR
jgi:basic amino acid/polyamine antiporter, APA family